MYYLVSVYENPINMKKKTKITCYYLYYCKSVSYTVLCVVEYMIIIY